MEKLKYVMHNITLPDGSQSLPGRPILSDTEEVRAMIKFAKQHFAPGSLVIDLGAGEGGYSIAFARAGFRVLAVEPRKENIALIKAAMRPEDNIEIKENTVESFMLFANTNIPKESLVLCLGLLYHLSDPVEILCGLCNRARAFILSTHFAIGHWQYNVPSSVSWLLKRICKRFPGLFRYRHFGLSRVEGIAGRSAGRWYPEYPRGHKNVGALTETSVFNHRSFWLTMDTINGITSGRRIVRSRMNLREQLYIAYFL